MSSVGLKSYKSTIYRLAHPLPFQKDYGQSPFRNVEEEGYGRPHEFSSGPVQIADHQLVDFESPDTRAADGEVDV